MGWLRVCHAGCTCTWCLQHQVCGSFLNWYRRMAVTMMRGNFTALKSGRLCVPRHQVACALGFYKPDLLLPGPKPGAQQISYSYDSYSMVSKLYVLGFGGTCDGGTDSRLVVPAAEPCLTALLTHVQVVVCQQAWLPWHTWPYTAACGGPLLHDMMYTIQLLHRTTRCLGCESSWCQPLCSGEGGFLVGWHSMAGVGCGMLLAGLCMLLACCGVGLTNGVLQAMPLVSCGSQASVQAAGCMP